MTTTAPPTPNLNHAAARLIGALDDLDALPGFIAGVEGTIRLTEAVAVSGAPEGGEAVAVLPVYRALVDLARAVQMRKENRDA